ncbi:MAG TPA: FCD domain-containing protein, partial [Pyrinomonadaceae bacterium]
LRESVEMHHKIYHAIRARNADKARAAMSEHLILAERALAVEEAANGGTAGQKTSGSSASSPGPS